MPIEYGLYVINVWMFNSQLNILFIHCLASQNVTM